MISSIIYSCFVQRAKFDDCDIFYKFVSGEFIEIELSYFIFIRAIVEKECLTKFFDRATGKCKDVRNYYLTKYNINCVLEKVFGYGKSGKINRFLQKLYAKIPEFKNEERLHVYKFLKLALVDYANCRKFGDNYVEEEINKQMVIDMSDPFNEKYEMIKRGYFPERNISRGKSKDQGEDINAKGRP
jgi:hypothetical protein